mmetsp:Transcript_17064/g.23892  ORF Transcript_17064/g.23892 Transcript_17064/m.23892 type:complete len:202 (+) Transcript_17064:369-974(+)
MAGITAANALNKPDLEPTYSREFHSGLALTSILILLVLSGISYKVFDQFRQDELAMYLWRNQSLAHFLLGLFFLAIWVLPEEMNLQIFIFNMYLGAAWLGIVIPINAEITLMDEPGMQVERFVNFAGKWTMIAYILIVCLNDSIQGIRNGGADPCLLFMHVPIAILMTTQVPSMIAAGPAPRVVVCMYVYRALYHAHNTYL